jgi:uncharacterized repeat protein (TIGR01451 family)
MSTKILRLTAVLVIVTAGLFLSLSSSFGIQAAPLASRLTVSMASLGTTLSQNFDTLASSGTGIAWADDSTLAGWYLQYTTTSTPTSYIVSTGSSNTGAVYSYGSAASTDRALGSIGANGIAASGLPCTYIGLKLTNNTGSAIASFVITYTGEQWRNGGNTTAQKFDFQYQIANSGVVTDANSPSTGWTDFDSLDFTGPITGAVAATLDGNAAANRITKTATLNVAVNAGQEIWIRWTDTNDSGNDHGLAVDDFSIIPYGVSLPNLSINDVTLSEGDSGTTNFDFVVSLSAPAPAGGVTFDIATADNTATQPTDYTQQSLTSQTIVSGSSLYTFTVAVNGDTTPEIGETFFVSVTNLSNANISDAQGQGTINNDDIAPNLTINDVSVDEGNAGTTNFNFVVSLSTTAPSAVTFDIATADGSAIAPGDYTSQTLTSQTILTGSSLYTFTVAVNGDLSVESDETFSVTVSNVTNAIPVDSLGLGTIVNDEYSLIHDVQGTGTASPITGTTVALEGIVIASYQGSSKLQGFFLQEEDTDVDADPSTSEGIFVYCGACPTTVTEGQRVKVVGSVSEFNNMTEVTASSAGSVVVMDAGNNLADVTATSIDLPIVGDIDTYYEAREGMLVTFVDTLFVAEYFELARYGQIVLSEGGRPVQFTETNPPDATGYTAHLDEIARREVILDDENNAQEAYLSSANGSQAIYYPHTNGGFSVGTQGTDYFRGGDQVINLTGVLHWSFPGFGADTWRIRPTAANPITFTVNNPRPTVTPTVGGAIKAVGMNLLNYFTTIDTTSSNSTGPCGPTGTLDCRGADSIAELNRQRQRASIVICDLNADVYSFMELENTTASASITDLLGSVNSSCGGSHPYTYVNTGGTLGTDAIRVEIIYRTGVLSPTTSALTDTDSIHNRPPTAQTFDVVDSTNAAYGERFTVVANHFKSKGCSGSETGLDQDQGDGQSCWADRRTQQATRLMYWITSTVIPAAGDSDVLLLGDFNSYAQETPVTTLASGGYTDLETAFLGSSAYSYLFDAELGHLDYAFANSTLNSQITGVGPWHINADEVPVFDYNDEIFDSPGEASFDEKPDGSSLSPARTVFASSTPYRASDHDPVLVGLFAVPNVGISKAVTPAFAFPGQAVTYTLAFSNASSATAHNTIITDIVPISLTNVSYANSGVTLTATNGITYEWQVGDLASGESGLITITGQIDPSAGGFPATLNNTATIDATGDVTATDDTASAAVTASLCFATRDDGVTVFTDVQSAVDAATDGDTIKIAGTCTGVQVRGGGAQTVYISKTLSVSGGYTLTNWTTSYPITQPTTLDALNSGRVIVIASANGNVSNLTIQNGHLFDGISNGSGLEVTGALTLTNVNVLSNTVAGGGVGGGAYVSGTALLIGGLFQNNTSNYGGGLYAGSTLDLTGTQFLSNTAGNNGGGGAVVAGAATLNGGLFQNNTAQGGGGGLITASTLDLSGTQFLSNTAFFIAGGAYVGGAATLSGGLFQNNQCTNTCWGGGLFVSNTLDLVGTHFINNLVDSQGGGAYVQGMATLTSGLFQNNTGNQGGGLYADSTLDLTDTLFISNTASAQGGGVFASNATTTLIGGQFQENASGSAGGGLYASALTLTNTQFLSNTATGSGGGVSAGSFVITGSTFFSNTAGDEGGAIATDFGPGSIENSDIRNNVATSNGGGVYGVIPIVQPLHITNTTIVSNVSGSSGGGVMWGGPFYAQGNQFLSNTAAINGGGVFFDSGHQSNLQDNLFQANQSADEGGALFIQNSSAVTLTANQILNNAAANGGGAIYITGPSTASTLQADNNFLGANTVTSGAVDIDLGGPFGSTVNGLHNTFVAETVGSGTALLAGMDTNGDVISLTNSIFDGYAIAAQISPSHTAVISLDGVLWNDVTNQTSGSGISIGNAITGTPAFVDRSSGNYHLTSSSKAIDRGVSTTLTDDIDGDVRPQQNAPDLGADETSYLGGDCFATPNDGTNIYGSFNADAVQNAVDAATDGDTIKIAGYCAGINNYNSETQTVYISKTVSLIGGYTQGDWSTSYPITQPTTLDAQTNGRVLNIVGVASDVSNLIVQNGNGAVNGGGIYASNAITLTNVNVLSSTAVNGGGAALAALSTVSDSTFTGNTTFEGAADTGAPGGDGGAIYNTGTLYLNNSTIQQNATGAGGTSSSNPAGGPGGNGGGVYNSGTLIVVSSVITANQTGLGGAGYLPEYGSRGNGGGIYNSNLMQVTDSTFAQNIGGVGGGLENFSGTASIDNTGFYSNTGDVGGGVSNYFTGTMTLTGTTIYSNTALDEGGGLWNDGNITVTNSTIAQNVALAGGGFYFETGSFVLINTPFLTNTAILTGGGLYAYGLVTLDGEWFQNNSAGSHGGGVYATSFVITGSTFISNTAGDEGGGLYVTTGPGSAENSEIRANTATSNGGGIYVNVIAVQPLYLTTTLIVSNTSGAYGGGVAWGGPVYVQDSQFLSNTAADSGGGLSATSFAITGSTFFNNTSGDEGGGIYVTTGPGSAENSTIRANTATSNGGGIYVNSLGVQPLNLTNTLVVSNVSGAYGGGVAWGGAVYMQDSQFLSNTAILAGGGAYANLGATLNGGLFQNNTSTFDEGGGLFASSTLDLTGTQFISNTAVGCGGGAFALGVATLNSGLFESNTSQCDGGGLYANSALALTDMQFFSNTTSGWGGAVYGFNNITALNSDFFYNSTLTNGGGAVAGDRNSASFILAFTNGTFKQNTAGNRGGGLYTRSTLFMTGTSFLTNTSTGNGGGVFASRNVALTDAVFRGNTGGATGGGASVQGTLTLATSDFTDNQANGTGGGAYAEKGATVIGGLFQANRTLNARGGGLRVIGSLALTDTRFISNTSGTEGGGLFAGGSNSRLVNALFARNRATTNIGAAAAFTGTVTVLHTTIADTGLNPGSAIFGLTSTVRLTNTIIASHTTALENWGGTFEQDYNLFFGNTTEAIGTVNGGANNAIGDPTFVDPANDDYHLGAGSTALNHGASIGILTDFEGDTRPSPVTTLLPDIGFDESSLVGGDCFATPDDGTTVFGSYNADAVQNAVDAASSGDTIKIAGTCAGVNSYGGDSQTVYVSKTLTLIGGYTQGDWSNSYPITQPTTLDAQTNGRGMNFVGVNGDVSNLTVQHGNTSGNGGGINADSALTLTNVNLLTNTSTAEGGGVYSAVSLNITRGLIQNNQCTSAGGCSGGGAGTPGDLTINSTQLISNSSGASGGGAWANGSITLDSATFERNQALAGIGGGLAKFSSAASVISGTQFLSNTASGAGGGVGVNGAVTLINGLFQNNASAFASGGGLSTSSTLDLTGTQFLSNTANGAGGGAFVDGAATLNNGLFQNNTSTTERGGGLYTLSTLALTGTQFLSNTAYLYGGGATAEGAATLTGGLFKNNSTSYGGGLYAGSTLDLTGTQFISNTAQFDGGGAVANNAATLNNGLFQNNRATTASGGGLYVASTLALTGTQFIRNTASNVGGGARVGGAATLNGGLFQNNASTSSSGGGLYAASALVLTDTQFLSNTANLQGGGIYVQAATTIDGAVFQSNHVISTTSYGGGLFVANTLNLINTQFLSNTSGYQGGGVFSNNSTNSVLQNNLFQYNSASDDGGAIDLFGAVNAILRQNRFLNNDATNGGGALYVGTSTATLDNNFFANNTSTNGAADVGEGSLGSSSLTGRHNSFAGSGTAISAGGDINGDVITLTNSIFDGYSVGAKTGPFAASITLNRVLWNNVTTQTSGSGISIGNAITGTPAFVNRTNGDLHLTSASYAIEHGVSTALTNDIDGEARPQGQASDLGADETAYSIDLGIVKKVTPSSVAAGQAVTYTLVYSNAGSGVATNVVITDLVPSQLVNVSYTSSGAAIVATGGITYVWGVANLTSGAGGIITITGKINPSLSGLPISVTNTAKIFGASDSNAGNNSSAATINVTDAAITGLSAANSSPTRLDNATAFTATVSGGSNIVYTWNFGDGTATASGNPTNHLYANAGVYTAIVTAANTINTLTATTRVTITNLAPIANAGVDQALSVSTLVTLNGSASSDPDNHTPLIYRWTQTSGTAVILSSSTISKPTFTAPGAPAILIFTLNVTDAHGLRNTLGDTVVITVSDVAISGLSAANSSPTRLDNSTAFTATASGTNIVYTWNFSDGTATSVGNPTNHTYTAAGFYTALVTATNGTNLLTATTRVTITNLAPIANAGVDQSALVSTLVTLNGSASSDPDNHTPLIYRWTQTGGTAVVLSSNTISKPTFTAPGAPSILIFTLNVTDAHGLRNAIGDTVVITVSDVAISGLSAANSSPTRLDNSTAFTATASGTNIVYTWNFGDGTATAVGNPTNHIYANAGLYTALVTATNGTNSLTATTRVTITNLAPIANAGVDQAASVSTLVTLNGSASFDPDNHTPLIYRWTQTGGTAVVLSSNTISKPTFTAPGAPSVLIFTLNVTDAHGLRNTIGDTVIITVSDVAISGLNAANSSPTRLDNATAFTATASGTNIVYTWNFGDGTATAVGNPTNHIFASAGFYTALVTATNGTNSLTATTRVTITNLAPIANAGVDQAVPVSTLVTLNGSASNDPDNHTPLIYRWTQTGGTAVVLSSNTISKPTFTAPNAPSVLIFTLNVTDAHGLRNTIGDTVIITVSNVAISGLSAANSSPTRISNPTALTATITGGTNVVYQWNFGDGTSSGSGAVTVHTYPAVGTYTATVTATNSINTLTATTIVSITNARLFLPIVANNFVDAPDLIVSKLIASSHAVTVVIQNIGTTPVADEFWVDFYVNPLPVPTGVNQVWSDGRSTQGVVWGITSSAFPALVPGGKLTLTLSSLYYRSDLSHLTGISIGTAVYAQVDSANTSTTYGGVQETHEINGLPYNNISGPIASTLSIEGGSVASPNSLELAVEQVLWFLSRLPDRPTP